MARVAVPYAQVDSFWRGHRVVTIQTDLTAHINVCATCNNAFETSDPDAVYCSDACAG